MANELNSSQERSRQEGPIADPRIWRKILAHRVPASVQNPPSALSPWERCWQISQQKTAEVRR
jgi:hypothetical protein